MRTERRAVSLIPRVTMWKSPLPARWRVAMLALLPVVALGVVVSLDPIGQDLRYHALADARTFFGVPNFINVMSNAPFLIVGVAGLVLCAGVHKSGATLAWATFFVGVALVAFGSGYYHAAPSNRTLLWDRLPMTLAFMGLFVALLSEHVNPALERWSLAPALVLGLASAGWWYYADDLRFYLWVQFVPLLVIPLVLLLFPPRYTQRIHLLYGLGLYALAKITELYDLPLFALTGETVSGHSLKHLLAAVAAACVYFMLQHRTLAPSMHADHARGTA